MRQNKVNKNVNDDNINNNDINLDFNEDETEIIYSIKEEENPLEFKEIIKMIVKDLNKKICCSGPALSIILDRINTQSNKDNSPEVEEYINNLDKLIRFNGKIFFRMLPDNKSNLIAFLQKDQFTVVAMCGDGANDSNAFMQSDVGVAINQTVGNNLISHFYSTESSINCLQVILKNGRACYESRINTLKYIMTASLIQLSVVFTLYYYYQQFNHTQYMFIDIILILFPCLLMTSTKTNYSLSNKKPPKKIVNLNFLLTVFGLYFLQFGGILIFILLGRKFCLDQILDLLPMDDLTTKSSYVFLFLSMQNNFLLLIINSWEINRLPFYTNKLYLLYFSIILIFLIRTITVINSLSFGLPIYRFESDKNEFKRNKETNKILILVINVFVQILSFFYNRFINKFFDWSEEGILIK
jgi:magnesium-transporting ATPase (P-type)